MTDNPKDTERLFHELGSALAEVSAHLGPAIKRPIDDAIAYLRQERDDLQLSKAAGDEVICGQALQISELKQERDEARRSAEATKDTGADPHPWYGPCDALAPNNACAECLKVIERLTQERDEARRNAEELAAESEEESGACGWWAAKCHQFFDELTQLRRVTQPDAGVAPSFSEALAEASTRPVDDELRRVCRAYIDSPRDTQPSPDDVGRARDIIGKFGIVLGRIDCDADAAQAVIAGELTAARREERQRCAAIADRDAREGRDDLDDPALEGLAGIRILAAERIASLIRSGVDCREERQLRALDEAVVEAARKVEARLSAKLPWTDEVSALCGAVRALAARDAGLTDGEGR